MNCLRPLEHWGRGFESYSMHAFFLCLCCPVCRRADLLCKESYRLRIWLRNWKSGQGPRKCCVESLMNEWMKNSWCVFMARCLINGKLNVPLTLQTLASYVYGLYVPTLSKAQMNLQEMYLKLQSEGMLAYNSN
jgi:hypothetical protein